MPSLRSQRESKPRLTARWFSAWRVSKPISFWGALILGFAAFLIILAIKLVAGSGSVGSWSVAEAAGTALGVWLFSTAGSIVHRVWPGENETEWRFNPSWDRVQRLFTAGKRVFPRMIIGVGLMILIIGLVLSFFIGFQAALMSAAALTALGALAHLVGHALIESRSVEMKEPLESVNDPTSDMPGS